MSTKPGAIQFAITESEADIIYRHKVAKVFVNVINFDAHEGSLLSL
ncbi:MAG: hypothetical protein ACTIJ4_02570 [Halomonas sp.]|nr:MULTISPECIES: hypothetical protein [Halomonas]